MKSRFLQNDDSEEQSQEEQPVSKPQPHVPDTKPAPKSRFQVQEDSDSEATPEQPVQQIKAPETKPKSKFMISSESENSENEDLKPSEKKDVPQTTNASKTKNKKKKGTKANETDAIKEEPQDNLIDEKTQPAEKEETTKKDKKKKGAPVNAALKKKIEEDRKRREELKLKAQNVFADISWDYRRYKLDDLREFAEEYKRKIENQRKKDDLREKGLLLTKKQREKKEKDERAKKAFIESQRQINGIVGNQNEDGSTVDQGFIKPPEEMRSRNYGKRPQRQQNPPVIATSGNIEAQTPTDVEVAHQQIKASKPVELALPITDKDSVAVVADDWEQMLGDQTNNKQNTSESKAIKQILIEADNWEDAVPDQTTDNLSKHKKSGHQKPAQPSTHKELSETKPGPSTKHPTTIAPPKNLAPVPVNPLDAFNSKSRFRCPIICIMGHVDTGKTKLLDHIRRTNVQANEAGGITQQIGASFFPQDKLNEEVAKVDPKILPIKVEIPGLLIIDTPGHESFANLRSRGSSLCDFAIVVIDVMHGVERQTIESIKMLQEKGTPFVIALNKIDRLYQWVPANDQSSYTNYKKQSTFVRALFDEKFGFIVAEMAKLDINIAVYWKQEDPYEYVPVVPTSAITGEGVPDLLGYIAEFTQTRLTEQVLKNEKDFKATVLEVKKAEGVGSTIDIIIVNGTLSVDDKIVLSGFNGPIDTFVKGLLTPHPLKEMRVKNEYLHHPKVTGSVGVRLLCPNLENAIAGSQIFKFDTQEQLDVYSVELQRDIKRVKKIIKLANEGVGVAASSLGSLEALLVFLKTSKIPVSTICIGDVSKNDLLKVLTPFLQDEPKKKKTEYLTMLCFDVKILPEAFKFGEENGIKMITAKIIYHLFDGFTKHVEDIKELRRQEEARNAVFPCILKQVMVFNKKDPIIIGVDVIEGILKIGTPLCVPTKEGIKIGVVESIEFNKKPLKEARKKTGSVAIRIKTDGSILHGRQFDMSDNLVSIISRETIDTLKEHFREELTTEDWNLVRKLKPFFNIK